MPHCRRLPQIAGVTQNGLFIVRKTANSDRSDSKLTIHPHFYGSPAWKQTTAQTSVILACGRMFGVLLAQLPALLSLGLESAQKL
jgi:hypothetical protein